MADSAEFPQIRYIDASIFLVTARLSPPLPLPAIFFAPSPCANRSPTGGAILPRVDYDIFDLWVYGSVARSRRRTLTWVSRKAAFRVCTGSGTATNCSTARLDAARSSTPRTWSAIGDSWSSKPRRKVSQPVQSTILSPPAINIRSTLQG